MITVEHTSHEEKADVLQRPLLCKTEDEVKEFYHAYEKYIDAICKTIDNRLIRFQMYHKLEELKSVCDRQIMMLRLRGPA